VRAVVTADTITGVTEGAKGRQSPGFLTYSNKRWRLLLFLFFCGQSQLIRNFTLKILAAQCLFRSDGGIVGLAKRLLLFSAPRVSQSLKWAASLGRL
jgi:hypothetical protein